ncbi:MAG: hypothetical protein ACE5ES_05410 [Candidatus Nanoarchaeia archaeon]
MDVKDNITLLNKLAKHLQNSGYEIADPFSGKRVESPSELDDDKSMGILTVARPRLLGVIPIPFVTAYGYPGDLWIDNPIRRATPNERWVFDVYGKENEQNLLRLGRQLAKPYGVEVGIGLVYDKQRFEGNALHWEELESQCAD